MVLAVLDLTNEGKEIFNLKSVCSLTGIRVEPPYTRGLIGQCHRCQLYGHSAKNCFTRPRCVKCLDDHATADCSRKVPDPAVPKLIRRTKYRVENRSTNSRTVIKDVFIPVNNTESEIVQFLKEHTIADRVFHCYFYDEQLYMLFSRVYTTIFNDRGPKLFKCTSRVTLVENKSEQEAIIKKYHEGKTMHRGIQETYKQIHRNYHWPNMLLTIQRYLNQCNICLQAKYERNPLKPTLALT